MNNNLREEAFVSKFFKYIKKRVILTSKIYRANKFKEGTREHLAYVLSRSKRIKENFFRTIIIIVLLLTVNVFGFFLDSKFKYYNNMVKTHKMFFLYSMILLLCFFISMVVRGHLHLKYGGDFDENDKIFRFYYMTFWILYYIFVCVNMRGYIALGQVGMKDLLIFMLLIVLGFVVPIYDFYELLLSLPFLIWEFISIRSLFLATGIKVDPKANSLVATIGLTIAASLVSAFLNYNEAMRNFYNEALMEQYGEREKLKSNTIFSEIYDEVYEINLSTKSQSILLTSDKYKSIANAIKLPYDAWIELYAKNLIHPDDQTLFLTKLSYTNVLKTKNERIYFEARCLTKNDQYVWTSFLFLQTSFEKDKDVFGFLLTQDIDSQKTIQAKLKSEAERDLLTNLYNKITTQNLIEAYLTSEGATGTHAMILMDIDSFKIINDTIGHAEGDRILAMFADCMKQSFRESDIISRVGGDEFLVFMKNINSIALVCDKLNKFLSAFKNKGIEMDIDIRLSASIGISIYRKDGITYDALFNKADFALYKAKKTGKDQYKFASSYQEGEESE